MKRKTTETKGKAKKRGRPTLYSDQVIDEICRRLHESEDGELPESLRNICRDDHLPCISTVMDWLTDKDKLKFSERYARARELRKDALADRLMKLGKEAITHATGECASAKVQAIKLEIDLIKWILSKEYGQHYGDKITQEITGKNGGAIISSPMSPEAEAEVSDCMKAVRASLSIPEGLKPLGT